MTESNIANTAQQEYWNTVGGPRWVGLGGLVERRNLVFNDLLLERSAVASDESVLEIGCGTGATTVPLAKAVGPRGRVVGVDISEPMLSGARQRLAESGLGNISLVQADAQVHRLEAGGFDLIVSRFGVMFFADPVAAFSNILPAARPDGRLCFVCWGPIEENRHWMIPYEVALRYLGPPAPTPPHAPGPLAFSDRDYVRSVLERAGFAEIAIDRETPDIIGSTPEEEAEYACVMGPPARLLDEKKPDDTLRGVIRREMIEAFAAYSQAKGMLLPSTVFLVTARRPS
jgi:SAM-dependent methyltransferase